MKLSNFSEVGHRRRSSGISTKTSTSPVTLNANVSNQESKRVGMEWRDYKHMMEKMIKREKWKIFAIPSATHTRHNSVVSEDTEVLGSYVGWILHLAIGHRC